MAIETVSITLRSPQLFFDKNSLIYFLAADYLITEKRIKFKILSKTPWCYSNSFVTCDLKIIHFPTFKKLYFSRRISRRFKNIFVRKHLEIILC